VCPSSFGGGCVLAGSVGGAHGCGESPQGLRAPGGSEGARGAVGARGVGHLEVAVHHEAAVHVLQAQDDLGSVEPHLCLGEDAVLGQVVMQVSSCGDTDPLSPAATGTARAGGFEPAAQASRGPGVSHRS